MNQTFADRRLYLINSDPQITIKMFYEEYPCIFDANEVDSDIIAFLYNILSKLKLRIITG